MWQEIGNYYYKNHTNKIIPITISYKICTNVLGRLFIGLALIKYDSVQCLFGLNCLRCFFIVILYFFDNIFNVFVVCVGGVFFCAGGRIVCCVLLCNKLFGKVNAQLLVPIYFMTDVFGKFLRDSLMVQFGLNSIKSLIF